MADSSPLPRMPRAIVMTALRLTAIMKTDIVGSTPKYRSLLRADLSALLAEHREFVSRLATTQEGRLFKAGGDGFWIAFPSVTGAGLAAMAMQEELRRTQLNTGDDRLAMRIVITLGDAFALKGFAEPIPVYRIEQTHHTQVIAGQYIVVTDLNNFSKFLKPPQLTAVEDILERLLEIVGQICREFEGTTRFNSGDAYCLTFSDPDRAMAATERLAQKWELFNRSENLGCPLVTALHKGALYLFRSHVYSVDLMVVSEVMNAGNDLWAVTPPCSS